MEQKDVWTFGEEYDICMYLITYTSAIITNNITKTESIQVSLPDMSAESPIMKNQLKRSYQ